LMVGIGGSLAAAVFAGFLLRASRAVRNPISSQMFNEYISSGSRATALSLLSVADSAFDLVLVLSLSAVSLWGLPAVFLGCAGIALAGMLLPVRTAEEEMAEMQERQGA
jgi:Asp/Glu/hydantoin racemase